MLAGQGLAQRDHAGRLIRRQQVLGMILKQPLQSHLPCEDNLLELASFIVVQQPGSHRIGLDSTNANDQPLQVPKRHVPLAELGR